LGYEDLVDHDQLRHDPTLAVLAGKLSARRKNCAPLAGRSTLNRLELGGPELTRYHRIAWDGCPYRLCRPNVVPMETAEPSDGCDRPDCLRRSMERGILVQRKVRAHPVIVGGVIRQQMAEVPFPQHHDMVEAFASDRADQPFNMTVLPR